MRPRGLLRAAASAILAATLLGSALPAPGLAAPEPRADPANAAQVAIGRTVYAERCAACHGAHLEGQPDWRVRKPDGKLPAPPHDIHGHTWHHPDEELFRIVKDGVAALAPPGYKTDMAGFGGTLSDNEIWAVLAYIKSTWPPEFQAYQRRLSEGAKAR